MDFKLLRIVFSWISLFPLKHENIWRNFRTSPMHWKFLSLYFCWKKYDFVLFARSALNLWYFMFFDLNFSLCFSFPQIIFLVSEKKKKFERLVSCVCFSKKRPSRFSRNFLVLKFAVCCPRLRLAMSLCTHAASGGASSHISCCLGCGCQRDPHVSSLTRKKSPGFC